MRPNCTLTSVFSFATDLFHRKIDCYVSFLKDHNRRKKISKDEKPYVRMQNCFLRNMEKS